MKILILLLILTGCASQGSYTFAVPFKDIAKCPSDRELFYKLISVNTNWRTKKQTVEYSWQCTKIGSDGDTYRVRETLGNNK